MIFQDRQEAGEKLAREIQKVGEIQEVQKGQGVVLGIPRGGVAVAKIVAQKLGWPLSLVVTKKVGAPGQEELAVGAMGPDGSVAWNESLLRSLGLKTSELSAQIQKAKVKVRSYQEKFNLGKLNLKDKTVIIVDDGVATGATVKAAIQYIRATRPAPRAVVVGVPVCAQDTAGELKEMVDVFVCLDTPEWFRAVGQFYRDFPQVSDEEVGRLLGTG